MIYLAMSQIYFKKEAYIIHSKYSITSSSVPPFHLSEFDVNQYTSHKYNQKKHSNEYYCQRMIYKGKKQN